MLWVETDGLFILVQFHEFLGVIFHHSCDFIRTEVKIP